MIVPGRLQAVHGATITAPVVKQSITTTTTTTKSTTTSTAVQGPRLRPRQSNEAKRCGFTSRRRHYPRCKKARKSDEPVTAAGIARGIFLASRLLKPAPVDDEEEEDGEEEEEEDDSADESYTPTRDDDDDCVRKRRPAAPSKEKKQKQPAAPVASPEPTGAAVFIIQPIPESPCVPAVSVDEDVAVDLCADTRPLSVADLFAGTGATTTTTTTTTTTSTTTTSAAARDASLSVEEDMDQELLQLLRVPSALPPNMFPASAEMVKMAMPDQWSGSFLQTVTRLGQFRGVTPALKCELSQSTFSLPEMQFLGKELGLSHLCATTSIADTREMMLAMCSAYGDQLKMSKGVRDAPTRLGTILPIFSEDGKSVTPLVHQGWHPVLLQMRAAAEKRGQADAGYRNLFLLDLRAVKLETKPNGAGWKHNRFHRVEYRPGKTQLRLFVHRDPHKPTTRKPTTRPIRVKAAEWSPYVVQYSDPDSVPKEERAMSMYGQTAHETGRVAMRSLCFVLVDDETEAVNMESFLARAQCAFTRGTWFCTTTAASRASGFNVILAKSGAMLHLAGVESVAQKARETIGLFRVYDHATKRCDPVAMIDYCRFMWRSFFTRDIARLLAGDIPGVVMRHTAEQVMASNWTSILSPMDLMRYMLWPLYFIHNTEPLGS